MASQLSLYNGAALWEEKQPFITHFVTTCYVPAPLIKLLSLINVALQMPLAVYLLFASHDSLCWLYRFAAVLLKVEPYVVVFPGKIRHLVTSDDLGPLTRILVVNALYFKGNWKQTFKAEGTRMMAFTKSDGSITKIPMMHLQLSTKLGHFTDHTVSYQVLELPYKGEEFSLLLILPAEDVAIEAVEKLITAELIKNWLAGMEEYEEVELSLPRFKIELTVDLKEILQPLNVTEIFNNGCDLSGITDAADVHISKAIQKVCIEVNEDGSEAAASTGMHVAAIMSISRNQFVANRPFLFILKHNSTGRDFNQGKSAGKQTEHYFPDQISPLPQLL
ncbi:serpin I2 isoform X3 [Hemicordylus capensis]|uniref:serpin I2 isoform X3 n=1 Tax=Hemicordylus capensis TaxID=884348 RepID=UPI002303FCF2|nr:serpin I2 isoform X3 [Hemicordylus capensis]